MSVLPLRVLALALFLQACTTTGPNVASIDNNATNPQERIQAHRTSVPPALASKPELPFDGPQVIFSPGSVEVPRTAAPVLNDIAAKLKADPLVKVVLIGHTEDMGSSEFSVAMADRCAQAVSQALIKRGARPSQIRLLPRGHDKVAKRCTTANCRKEMRRVDIVLSEY